MALSFRFIVLLLVSLSLGLAPATAQILDDSTKQIYGAKSTRYRKLEDVFNNVDTLYNVDTLNNTVYRQADFTFRTENPRVDIGNMGSPNRPLFFSTPMNIGRQYGFTHFDVFAYNPLDVQYFNTQSPYTKLNYLQGGGGRQILEATHSRNINRYWNISFSYRRFTSFKQIGTPRREEREADHNAYQISSSYITKNGRYQVYGHWAFMNHRNFEVGGVQPFSADSIDGKLDRNRLFGYEQEPGRLSAGSYSREIRRTLNIYQQFNLDKKAVQAYHKLSFNRRKNLFFDQAVLSSTLYNYKEHFPTRPNLDSSFFHNEFSFQDLSNEVGIKGQLSWAQASVFVRRRDFRYSGSNTVYTAAFRGENYLGGTLNFSPFKNASLNNSLEFIPGRDFAFRSKLETGPFYARLELLSVSPTLFSLNQNSSLISWDNNGIFRNSTYQSLAGGIRFNTKILKFNAELAITRADNFIYYDMDLRPKQSSAQTQIGILKLQPYFKFNYFHLENDIWLTQSSGADIIRMPALFYWGRYFYSRALFKNALKLQVGLDMKYTAGYKGDYYMPALNQFLLNTNNTASSFDLPSFLVFEPFISGTIGKAVIYARATNVMQNTLGFGGGYFATPFYPGLRRLIGFGIIWSFYD